MEYTKDRFVGISCAYLDPDDRITTEYAGFADKENGITVDENTVFPACSISKFVTFTIIVNRLSEGRKK